MSADNEFNAFTGEVSLGGLRNQTHIKVLITFVVMHFNEPIKKEMLVESLTKHQLANYFEITQALDELAENGNLGITQDEMVYITPKGALSVEGLVQDLPKTVRETALADAMKLRLLEKRENENTVDIRKEGDAFFVTFRVTHKEDVLMELTVYAADREQAERLKKNFLKDPSHVYATVAAALFV